MEKQESIKDRLFQNNNSSLNNSKSKAMYTFPKDDRFPALVAEGVYISFNVVPNSMIRKVCSTRELPLLAMETNPILLSK